MINYHTLYGIPFGKPTLCESLYQEKMIYDAHVESQRYRFHFKNYIYKEMTQQLSRSLVDSRWRCQESLIRFHKKEKFLMNK